MSGVAVRREIEAFVRGIVAEIALAERAGWTTAESIAAHLNMRAITTRKGRPWTAATVRKFLSSPGARRFRGEREAH